MVEYALVLPIFLIILMFTLDIGWITYQKVMFDYTCRNSAWDLRLTSDEDWVLSNGREIIRSGGYANELLSDQFKKADENASNTIDMNNISISNSKIGMYPGEKIYKHKKVSGIKNDIKFKTVTVEIESKIQYQIFTLTPLTKPFFKEGIKLTNNLYKAKKATMEVVEWPT